MISVPKTEKPKARLIRLSPVAILSRVCRLSNCSAFGLSTLLLKVAFRSGEVGLRFSRQHFAEACRMFGKHLLPDWTRIRGDVCQYSAHMNESRRQAALPYQSAGSRCSEHS